ncbi:MAG TPA: hypothetical protein VI197_13515 [Polyangiaceae bacterium]
MMPPKLPLFAACLTCACTLTLSASAQEHSVSNTPDGYAVEFSDSDLLGQSLDLAGLLIPIRGVTMRVLLIRPRASFVPELSKSIEAL